VGVVRVVADRDEAGDDVGGGARSGGHGAADGAAVGLVGVEDVVVCEARQVADQLVDAVVVGGVGRPAHREEGLVGVGAVVGDGGGDREGVAGANRGR